MAICRVQVRLAIDDAIPEDRPVNTFHITTPMSPVWTNVNTAIKAAYDEISGIFSPVVAQNGHEIKAYDLADPEPRAPVYSGTFNLTTSPTAGGRLPSEVALCVSFQGDRESGVPQARRRGRMYLGPLRADTVDSATGRPTSGTINDARDFGEVLAEGLWNTASCVFGIWSVADNAFVTVTNGWVDNAFDTQRRRGMSPTSRTTYTVVV